MLFDYLIPKPLHKVRDQLLTEYLVTHKVRVHSIAKVSNSIACILYNITYNLQQHENKISICLRPEYFSLPLIYNGVKVKRKISFTYFKSVVEWLVSEQYVIMEQGQVVKWRNGKPLETTKTTLEVTEKLNNLLAPVSLSQPLSPKGVLELRGSDKKPLQYRKTSLQEHYISLVEDSNSVLATNTPVLEGKQYPLHLCKVFNIDWDYGGRYYPLMASGSALLRRGNRSKIMIGGESTVECDFSALHPRILATQAGVTLSDDFDPYDIPQGRELGKLATLIVVNCGVGKRAVRATAFHSGSSVEVCEQAIDNLVKRNPYLTKCKGKMNGLRLQNIDSKIMDGVVRGLVKQNKGFVPIHDSVVVQQSMCQTVVDLMTESYTKVMGTVDNCLIKVSKP